jgi:hypothetical protein
MSGGLKSLQADEQQAIASTARRDDCCVARDE